MGSEILQFVIVNAIPLAGGSALLCLLIFTLFNRFGTGLMAALFALLLALLYLVTPFFGGYLTLVTLLSAFFIREHYLGLTITILIINLLNLLLFSPLLKANATGAIQAGDYKWAIMYLALILLQIIVGVLIFHRYLENRREDDLVEPFEYMMEEEEEVEILPSN
jgi:hypothetical protein